MSGPDLGPGDVPLGDDELWRDGLRRVFLADQSPWAAFGPLVASLDHEAVEYRGQRSRTAPWDPTVVVSVERTYEVQGGLHAGASLSVVTWTRDPEVLERSDLLAGSPVVDHLYAGLSAVADLDDAEEARVVTAPVERFPGWEIARASGYTAVLEQRDGVAFTLAVPDELLELTTRIALVPNTEWDDPTA
ncbi:hypothetical protein [Frigoribacterium faeni]|uniref:hypothetical protein n=1 Tax=Frigoribacterium faeni TaxID=145483 RepID=UPI00141A70F3|nr:hypothetical protein [Frigoribacterium faeni]NIJ05048.1 hypothetical protein [Frigoribacterium faeni]